MWFHTQARECVMFVCFHAPSLTSGILSWELDSLVDSFSFFPTTTEASSSSPRVHLFFSSRWKSGSYLKLFLSALTFCSTLTTAQLKSASFEDLTAVVSRVTHPWGWQLYHSRGKSSSVLLLVTGVELVVWMEERFHSCSTRNVDPAL